MKKFTLIFALVAFTAFSAQAQIKVTPVAGLNFATVGFSNGEDEFELAEEPDYGIRIGWQVGGLVQFDISESFGVRPGLLISSKGATAEDEINGTTIEATNRLTYLEIPVDAVVSFPVSDDLAISLNAGPYLGLGISGGATTEFNGEETDTDIEFGEFPADGGDPETSYVNPLDFGINFGVGATYSNFFVNINYGLGLTNTSPMLEEEPDGYDRSKIASTTNQNLAIRVGYSFPLGE